MIRFFDVVFSIIILLFAAPLLIIISILISLESKGGILFKQLRVGKNNRDFFIYKFRTMYRDSEKKGLLTVGERDPRVTGTGYFLRRYKLDEFPQFFNVLKGEMSIVGPRPEVRKYVDLYTEEQKKVLLLKPGITDFTSILFKNESEILSKSDNAEEYYKNILLQEKLKKCLSTDYSLKNYFLLIIFTTFNVNIKRFRSILEKK